MQFFGVFISLNFSHLLQCSLNMHIFVTYLNTETGCYAMIARKKKLCRGCDRMRFLFAKGQCKICHQRENPVKINRVSENMKVKLDVYAIRRKEYLAAHPLCEAKLPGCRGAATEIHHLAGRIGDKLLDTSNFMAICRNCHRKELEMGNEAFELGIRRKRN